MNILIYGYGQEQNTLENMIERCGPMQYRKIAFSKPGSYDDYVDEMKRIKPHIVFVYGKGADGMEAVIAARNLHPETAVVWFSDDAGFLSQSYRLGCAYFTAEAVTDEVIKTALAQSNCVEKIG